MWALQLLLIASVSFLAVLAGKAEDNMAKYYCNKIGYTHIFTCAPAMFQSDDVKQANASYSQCTTRFLELLSIIKLPSETEIDHFIEICTARGIGAKQCTQVIENLSVFGYTFGTAAKLFEDLNVNRPDIVLPKKWNDICLDCSLREELLHIDNFNVDKCILYFWTDKFSKEAVLRTYRDWVRTEIKKITYCDCDQVLGLYSIYDGRKETDIKVLHDYYENICSEDFPEKTNWNKDNLKCIGESKLPLNGAMIKQFLKTCVPLSEVRWCEKGNTLVPFDYLWDKVKSASVKEIKTVSYAVSANFNGDHYNKLLQILMGYGNDLNKINCLHDIIEAAFQRDVNVFKEAKSPWKTYAWDFKDFKDSNANTRFLLYDDVDHPFNTHVQILLELFLKTKTSITCKNLVTYLSEFKSILLKRNFSVQSLTVDLSELNKKRMDFADVIECYQFTLDVEDQIFTRYSMLKNLSVDGKAMDYDFFGYKYSFSELRRLIFKKLPPELTQICKNQHREFNINSLDGIWNLINLVFKNIDYSYRDLNDLFLQVLRKPFKEGL